MRAGPVGLVVVALVIGCAGCGSSSSSSTAAKITKAQYVARANAICAKGNAEQNRASAKLGNSPSPSQVTHFVNTFLVPNIQGQINAIRALGAPPGDQAKVNQFMSDAQADLNRIKANPQLATSSSLFNNFSALAHPYGLTQCAKSS